jgi:hypothetical protein
VASAALPVECSGRPLSRAPHQKAGAKKAADDDFGTPSVGTTFVTYGAGQSFGSRTVASGSVDHIGSFWAAARDEQPVDVNRVSAGALLVWLKERPSLGYQGAVHRAATIRTRLHWAMSPGRSE